MANSKEIHISISDFLWQKYIDSLSEESSSFETPEEDFEDFILSIFEFSIKDDLDPDLINVSFP